MPDWEQMLREQLGGMQLNAAVREEVIAELAGHLEDVYERLLGQGIGAEEAQEKMRSEFSNGRELARKIWRAKRGEEEMNNRTKQIWVPGLVTTGLATILLSVLYFAGVKPMVVWTPAHSAVMLHVPWLMSLPVLGFFGAYWSGRAGGRKGARIIAGIFTSLLYLAVPFPLLPLAMVVDHGAPTMALFGWGWYFVNWAGVPCIALLAGALPAAMIGRDGRTALQSVA